MAAIWLASLPGIFAHDQNGCLEIMEPNLQAIFSGKPPGNTLPQNDAHKDPGIIVSIILC